jgi:DNA-directed RNA polymerase subunit M/transcription elongation factor TFIIS
MSEIERRIGAGPYTGPDRRGSEGPPCPECGQHVSAVLESRSKGDEQYRRRRECCHCGARFTTYEALKNTA